MRKVILSLMIACLLLTERSLGQAPPQKKYIFASNLKTLDWPEVFKKSDKWIDLRPVLYGFKMYQGPVWPNPPANVFEATKPNTANAMLAVNAFWEIRFHYQKALSVEVTGMKSYHCLNTDADIFAVAREILASINFIIVEGSGSLESITFDPNLGAMSACRVDAVETANRVGRLIVTVQRSWRQMLTTAQQRFPEGNFWIAPLQFGDTGSYPSVKVADHIAYLSRLNQVLRENREPLIQYYDFDFDDRVVSDDKLVSDYNQLVDYLQSEGIEVGILMTGTDAGGEMYLASMAHNFYALGRMIKFKQLGMLRPAKRIVIQTFSMRNDVQDFPPNLPETDPSSWTAFANHVQMCLEELITNCAVYPQPRPR